MDLWNDTKTIITGPGRAPSQLLAEQSYDGHMSVHDEESAKKLGIAGAPIEGPTHFSQFEPLLWSLWGDEWFSNGCLSSHFLNMVVEGEEVQATITADGPGARLVQIDAAKTDGSPVLTGSASVGPEHPPTALAPRIQKFLDRPLPSLHIIDQLQVGQKGAKAEEVTVTFDESYGALYPFSLEQKLDKITERCWYFEKERATDNPWGKAIVPIEMLSVLSSAVSSEAGFTVRQPSIGLFVDLEVRLLGTPVFVGNTYRVEHEIVAMGESRRTESYWRSSNLIDVETNKPAANILLHQGVFKDSYADYPR